MDEKEKQMQDLLMAPLVEAVFQKVMAKLDEREMHATKATQQRDANYIQSQITAMQAEMSMQQMRTAAMLPPKPITFPTKPEPAKTAAEIMKDKSFFTKLCKL